LISTTLSGATTLFNYNGDGVWLKQIVGNVATTYTPDCSTAAGCPTINSRHDNHEVLAIR
jgi:hypothetical protein